MKRLLIVLAACHAPSPALAPSPPAPLPAAQTIAIDTTPKERRRMVPPEVYLRAYIAWFGGLAPLDVQQRAKPKNLFDAWDDYLAALGLPDYRIDLPRQTQSNTLMLATLGRLGEALCVRASEHDFDRKTPKDARVVFAFDVKAQFADGLDVLHRTFLGYPLALAPKDRESRFNTLFQYSLGRHKKPELAWAAVCTALVQHPEAELY
jgi:hypothetical protein